MTVSPVIPNKLNQVLTPEQHLKNIHVFVLFLDCDMLILVSFYLINPFI